MTQEQRQAYEWAKNQNYQSVAARYAKILVGLVDELLPPNDPLTLDELLKMDGEPVWVTPLGFWALVIARPGERVQLMSNDGEKVWADKEIELVGPVYRRPPEGEA